MPYFVEAYADDCKLTAKVRTAKKAFAKAIDWRIVGQISAVTIRDGRKSYSIEEFAEAMAQQEIASADLSV